MTIAATMVASKKMAAGSSNLPPGGLADSRSDQYLAAATSQDAALVLPV